MAGENGGVDAAGFQAQAQMLQEQQNAVMLASMQYQAATAVQKAKEDLTKQVAQDMRGAAKGN